MSQRPSGRARACLLTDSRRFERVERTIVLLLPPYASLRLVVVVVIIVRLQSANLSTILCRLKGAACKKSRIL